MSESDKQDLTVGPVAAHLRRQATPFSFGLVAIFSFEAADLFFISKLGDAPLKTLLDSWRHMLAIGIPAMITNAIIPVSSGIVVALIATYGVDAVAGFGVAMRLEPMFLIPF